MTSVAFIIPHMGREGLLIDTLNSISALKVNDIRVSVVVASKNKSFSDELLGYKQSLAIQFLTIGNEVTISDQRNMGVRQTKSDYLAFIDADIALSTNWLIAMLKVLDSPNIVLASAVQKASEEASELENVRVLLSNLSVDCTMEFLPGRNLLLSRTTFDKTGGFPSELVTCEDYVFTQNVSQYGQLYYSTSANYIHLGEDKEYLPMAKKEVWRGQSNLASIKGRHIPLSEYPSFIAPPLFTLGLLGFLVALIAQYPIIALLSISGSCGILALYTFRLWKKRHEYPSLFAIVAFYALYFPARTIGTVMGAVKTLETGTEK
ncbi:MAG: GT2 family glycosyltransferase [Alphaproteobacteria bacterium]|jgi:GT2 family glycosyltransferase